LTFGAYAVHQYTQKAQNTSTFTKRLSAIADHVNSLNTTWKAEVPAKFANQTEESVKSFFMRSELYRSYKTPKDMLKTHSFHVIKSAPESFDSRTEWASCESIQEVRDQSACGSCWAFGAAEVMSDRICIHSGQKDQTRVSTEDLLECCAECGFGCQGGFPPAAFNFWKEHGVVTGGLHSDKSYCKPYAFPPCAHHTHSEKYTDCPTTIYETPTCKKECANGDDYSKSKTYAAEAGSVTGHDNLRAEISQNGPVEVAFSVYEDFLAYKSGVYQHVTGASHGGHAVKMIGWGSENGTDYWIIANSWNESWGEGGFFRILRGSNHCGIEDQGSFGTPAAKRD